MKNTSAMIGRSTVVFESTDTEVDSSLVLEVDEYGMQETSSRVEDAYNQLKKLLQDVSADLGGAIAANPSGLSEVSIEFAVSFTGEGNVWVVKTTGQGAVKATLTWNLKGS